MTDVATEPVLSNDELRDEVRRWLDENWDPDLEVGEWWRMVADAGWTAPHLTDRGGRSRAVPPLVGASSGRPSAPTARCGRPAAWA